MAGLAYLLLSLLGLSLRQESTPSANSLPTEGPVSSIHCGANEEYLLCVDPCNKCPKAPAEACARPQTCVPGCNCIRGYARSEDGVCIPKAQCDSETPVEPVCGADEQFYKCRPSCKNTCSHWNNPGVRCRCAPAGCFCRQGLVKRSDGKCVPPSECPDDALMGGCMEARCVLFCRGYGMRGGCREAIPGGEKKCFCSK